MSLAWANEVAAAAQPAVKGVSLEAIFLILFTALLGFFFWSVKNHMTRQTTSQDKLRGEIMASSEQAQNKFEKVAEMHSACREGMLSTLAQKADRIEIVRAHERLDEHGRKICDLDIQFQAHMKKGVTPW